MAPEWTGGATCRHKELDQEAVCPIEDTFKGKETQEVLVQLIKGAQIP